FGVLAGYSVLAQGTVQFQNTTVSTAFFTNAGAGARGKVTTNANTIAYALFYSDITTGGSANSLAFATAVGNSTAGFGVIDGSTVLPLAGTSPGDTVALMIISYDASLGISSNGVSSHLIGVPGSGTAGGMNGQWDGSGKWFAQSPTIQLAL